MSDDLMALGRRTAHYQDEMSSCAETLDQVSRRLAADAAELAQRDRAANASRRRWALAGGLAAAAMTAALLVWLGAEPATLTYVVDHGAQRAAFSGNVTATSEPVYLRFSDGSVVTLGTGANARVLRLDTLGAALALQTGHVDLDVEHTSEATSWQLEAGPYTVYVVGTRFTVEWDAAQKQLVVAVREGKVRVEGPGLSQRVVAAGETLRATPPNATAAQTDATLQTSQASPTAFDAEHQPKTTATSGRKPTVVSKPRSAAPAEALLARARALSREDPAGATDLLQDVRERFPDTQEAHDATFMLARLQHDPARALPLLEAYRREQPQGTFAEAALGRAMRARIALGQRERARRDARAYLDAYPHGPYAAEARRVLAQ